MHPVSACIPYIGKDFLKNNDNNNNNNDGEVDARMCEYITYNKSSWYLLMHFVLAVLLDEGHSSIRYT